MLQPLSLLPFFTLLFLDSVLYSILVNGEIAMAKTRWHFGCDVSGVHWDGCVERVTAKQVARNAKKKKK